VQIAILGGGPAGLAAAFDLTDPALPERHEVTVYEQSWRLGGKCASGRNAAAGDRIEEHGLHIWFGFYANAFDVLRRALAEQPDAPFRTLDDAFTPHDTVRLTTRRHDGTWAARDWSFPPADGELGVPEDITFADVVRRAIDFLRAKLDADDDAQQLARGHEPDRPDLDGATAVRTTLDKACDLLDLPLGHLAVHPIKALMVVLRELVALTPDDAEHAMDYALVLDVFATIVIGLVEDDLTEPDADWSSINDEELCAWLQRHGSKIGDAAAIAQTPMARCFYELCFAYRDGDRDRPDLAAGKALQALLRLAFSYHRQVMWKMNSGMGDTIFTPLYEVLRARGVRFAFYHRVCDLHVDDGGDLTAIDIARTHVPSPAAEDPLVPVGRLRCWPAAPKDDLPFDPEHDLPADCEHRVLRRGTDFDKAVLAIPVAALPPITRQVAAASPPFAQMLDTVPTVATQALQLWFATRPPGAGDGRGVAGAFLPPLDTCSGMDQILPTEGHPDGAVAHVAYLCGAMRDIPGETRDAATARAGDDGHTLIAEHAQGLGLTPDAPDDPDARWSVLYDPEHRTGPDRFAAQYWRANTDGTHRYTLTPAGSIASRLRPHESGVGHLLLAGDWTRNGICGGSVEAAVTSGRLAARAIDAALPHVHGVSGWLERD
jgi:uncharacterized protein with NAD-binding domain and iron-sulfur cluster